MDDALVATLQNLNINSPEDEVILAIERLLAVFQNDTDGKTHHILIVHCRRAVDIVAQQESFDMSKLPKLVAQTKLLIQYLT